MAREAYAGQLALKPGVRAFLEQCREHGVPMAVLTSCIPELCRAALAHHGILDWFQGVVYAQETGIGKGEPELYRLAAERWGRAPGDCVLLRTPRATAPPPGRRAFSWPGCGTPLYAGREEEIQALCRGWVDDFRRVPEPLLKRVLGDGRAACRERFETVKQGRKKYLQFPEICDKHLLV